MSSLNFDLANASNTTLTLLNSGGGVANLNLNGGSLQTAGTTRLTNAGVLQNITGLTSSGNITFSALNSAGVLHTNSSGLLSTSAVALGTDTSGSYVANLGTLTGLTASGNSGAGSTPTLSVTYGDTSTSAVRGDTTLTCASGSGNLSGGGGTITLGTGGTCTGLTMSATPSFTSVTATTMSSSGALSLSSTGVGNDVNITSGSGTINLAASTLKATSGLTFDLNGSGSNTYSVTNSGSGTADLNLLKGGLQIGGTSVLTSGRVLQNVTASTSILTSGTLGAARGGTGLDASAAANGQLLIGNGSGFSMATLTNSGGLTITNSAGGIGLAVNYGSSSGTAAQGNTSLSFSGSGNLTGTVSGTAGGGISTNTLAIVNNPSFSTSVTTPSLTSSGGLSLSSTGVNDLTLTSGSGTVVLGAATLKSTGSLSHDLNGTGSNALTVTNSGSGTADVNIAKGGLQIAGTSVLTSGRALQNLTGLTVASGGANITGGLTAAGTITFGGLNSAGVLHTNASGVVSTSAVALGTDTSGSYVANLGTLTGLTAGGNSGAASTPTLSVTYGSSSTSAVRGDITLTCASGSGNLSGGGGTITLGTGGTCTGLTMVNNPSFTGLITGSASTTGLALTGAPTNSATSSLVQIGSPIAAGDTTVNGGTYLGLNAPGSGAGSAADFLNFQTNGVSKLRVTSTGDLTANGQVTGAGIDAGSGAIQGTGGLAITGNSTITGSLSSVTSITSSGAIQGTTLTGTTGLVSNGGIYTGVGAGTQRLDVSGNLVNIGNFTSTGAITFATTGATGFTFKPGTDSATAFQIQSATGPNTLFKADTSGSNIVVSGTGTTFATLTITNSHFESTQTTAPTVATPTSCGTTPTAVITPGSTDAAGSFYINEGSGTAGICTTVITFNKAYGAAPKAVILSPNHGLGGTLPTAAVVGVVSAKSTTTFTVRLGSTGVASNRYGFDYWVIE
jgi:hypothetical protein